MKIVAVCGSGLGSSLILSMNIKKVLKKLNIEADVSHTDVASVVADQADLFMFTKDLEGRMNLSNAISLNSIIDEDEITKKLQQYFNK